MHRHDYTTRSRTRTHLQNLYRFWAGEVGALGAGVDVSEPADGLGVLAGQLLNELSGSVGRKQRPPLMPLDQRVPCRRAQRVDVYVGP